MVFIDPVGTGYSRAARPDLAAKFFAYYQAVFAEGELTEREKALIALAVAHTVQCPYCIDAYTRACLEKGSNVAEMTEAVHVAVAIRGDWISVRKNIIDETTQWGLPVTVAVSRDWRMTLSAVTSPAISPCRWPIEAT